MKFGIQSRETLPQNIQNELDQVWAAIATGWNKEHLASGAHGSITTTGGTFTITSFTSPIGTITTLTSTTGTITTLTSTTATVTTANLTTANITTLVASGVSRFAGPLRVDMPLSPSQITGNQNDYAPTGITTANVLRLSTDASRDLTGLSAGQASGREIRVINVGAQNLVLKHASGSSSAANQFSCPGAADFTLNAGDGVLLWYDGTTSTWRVLGF